MLVEIDSYYINIRNVTLIEIVPLFRKHTRIHFNYAATKFNSNFIDVNLPFSEVIKLINTSI